MHTKNVTEAFVYSHHIQFQTTRYTLLMRISLGIADSKSRLGFQPTYFLPCWLNRSMKWKADWLTAARKASLND